MASIDTMLDDIILREGGFVNDPADRGGATNYGITQATLSDWLGRQASIADVQGLTTDEAKQIYAKNYFTGPKLNQLPELIQPVMLDAAVNSGVGRSIKWLQTVLNETGHGPLTVDGGIGPQTIAAANAAAAAMGADLNKALIDIRRTFLQALVQKDPSQKKFENGWMNRCAALETEYA